jgi:hypothetical protein
MDCGAHQTIHIAYRSSSRFARIRLHRRHRAGRPPFGSRITAILPALDVPEEPTDYTPELAIELLAGTCEIPESKRALFIVLGEYRHALHTLACQALNGQQPAAQ